MSANLTTSVTDNPLEQNGGVVWYRLHSERETICETLLKGPRLETETTGPAPTNQAAVIASNWHRELLQARLRKVDNALDRLMSGGYGNCSKCGKWIEDTKLEFDAAIEFCLGCWEQMQIH